MLREETSTPHYCIRACRQAVTGFVVVVVILVIQKVATCDPAVNKNRPGRYQYTIPVISQFKQLLINPEKGFSDPQRDLNMWPLKP